MRKDDKEVMSNIITRCLTSDMFATAMMVSLLRPPKKKKKKAK